MRSIVWTLLALGCLLAVSADASGGRQYSMAIKQVDVDGKQRSLSWHEYPDAFALSPDHTLLAYVLSQPDGERSNDLRVAEVRGTGERSLVRAPSSIFDVAWAPNGRTIALSVAPDPRRPAVDGIWLVEADGTGLHRVADYGIGLAWSPDSKRLAMSRRIDLRPPDLVSVLSVETGVVHDVATGRRPLWSPDGKFLLYESPTLLGDTLVRIAPAEGGPSRTVARGWSPSWSPDGKRIAFHRPDHKEPVSLWIVSSRGGRPMLAARWASVGIWSPNGRWIAFVKERSAFLCGARFKSTLGLVRLSNGKTRQLLVTRRALSPVAWSRDSRKLLFLALICPGY